LKCKYIKSQEEVGEEEEEGVVKGEEWRG